MKPIAIFPSLLLGLFFLSGCASDGVAGLPHGAALVQEGNASVTYAADGKGTIFVRDQPANRIIYEGNIEPGQELIVDAKAGRITLNRRPLTTTAPLRPDATYQVYFKAEDHHEYHPMMNP
jgi:hypothetical protein